MIFLRTNGQLEITFDTDLATATQGLILNVDGTDFAFEDADSKLAAGRVWFNSGQSWSAGDSVSLTLIEPASTDATLSDLALEDNNGTTISLTAGATRTYTASVVESVDEITVLPTVNDSNATYEIQDGDGTALTDADTNTTGFQVAIDKGENTVKVEVTAEDGSTIRTYTITVTREDTTPPAPLASGHPVDESGLGLFIRFNENLDLDSAKKPPLTAFTVTADGTALSVSALALNIGGDPRVIGLSFHETIEVGQVVRASYTDPTSGDDALALQDAAGNDVASFSNLAVTNNSNVDQTPPAPLASGHPVDESGLGLFIRFNENLDLDSAKKPPLTAFTVTADGTALSVSALALNIGGDPWVIGLSFDETIAAGQVVRASYTDPTAGDDALALQDAAGNDVASFSNLAVTNNSTVILSTDATLSGLALKNAADDSAIDLNETFATATKSYTADVLNAVDEITVEPTSDHNATFAYLNASDTVLTDADSLKTGFQAALAAGANTVKVKVTAEAGDSHTDTYTVVVTRRAMTTTPPAPAEIAVPNDWSLIPTGLGAGDKFRLLFLSSTKTDGESYDIADYNTFIQGRAAAGHTDIRTYSPGFRAVGCTADSDATANTGTTGTGVVIHWLNGNKVADDYADFYDGNWDEESNSQDKNELGTNGPNTSQSVNYPLTGCDDDGTEDVDGGTSYALGESEVRVARPGSSAGNAGPLTSNSDTAKANTRPMYGLSQVFEVAPAGNTPATGKPSITGAAQAGMTLTAGLGDIADADGLPTSGYMYQWISGGTPSWGDGVKRLSPGRRGRASC